MKRALEAAERRQKPLILSQSKKDERDLPIIVNFVTKIPILPPGYHLPLMSICAKWGCSQYAPNLFAANIIKIRDAVTTSTVLLFISGVMVVVSGESLNHARSVSQYIRLNIERTRCMMHDPETGEIKEGTLKGRTICSPCAIHNIVGHGSVGFKMNLQRLVDAAANCWKWYPDLFPGAKGKIWLTDTLMCECDALNSADKRIKCKCSIKVIAFDSGQVVVTGGRTIEQVNYAYQRILRLAPDYESSNQEAVPRDERFYKRLADMMIPTGLTTKRIKSVQRQELNETEVIACVLAGVELNNHSSSSSSSSSDLTPLMKMAEQGRVADVEMLLMLDPDQLTQVDAHGKTALDRLVAMPDKTHEIKQIIQLLQNMQV